MKAKCPFCDGLYGPLANDLLTHLKDAHQKATGYYDASTGELKLVGRFSRMVEFVPDKEEE